MNTRFKKFITNPYVLITLVYLLAHFFLLILTGCWWDDWTFMTHDLSYVNVVATESGRPEWNLLIPLCWSLPNNGRILIFILYYLDSLFVYTFLKNSDLFNKKDSLIISLLFAVIPVNEARLLISNFSYTVGLFFFYLSLMLFAFWNKMNKGIKKNVFRVFLLLLFFVSFILNSILAYYYILIAYLFVLDIRKNDEKNLIKKVLISVKNTLVRYPDFFILPFVYYGINKTFFPTYGPSFGDYNEVTIGGLLKSLIYIPLSLLSIVLTIIKKSISCINVYTVIILVLLIAFILFINRKRKDENEKTSINRVVIFFVYGLFISAMALLPYVTVRGGVIDSIGVKGRDAVLIPLGLAIMAYSVLCLFKKRIRFVLSGVLIAFGIFSFNSLYLEWQKDYYYQLSMENLFRNKVIADNDTFFLIDLDETEVQGQRYYSLSINAYHIYEEETRFFIPKVSNLYILEDKEGMRHAIEDPGFSHMMRDYKPEDYYFDAILNYSDYLSDEEVLKLRYYESFDKERFKSIINSKGKLEVTVVDDDFTKKLLKEYNEGNLQGDEDVLDLLNEYVK